MRRTPSVPSSRAMSRARPALVSGRAITVTRYPGLPFFMMTGVALASRAPAAMNRARASPITSPLTSSTFVSRRSTVSCGSAPVVPPPSPGARSGVRRVPAPGPVTDSLYRVPAGIGRLNRGKFCEQGGTGRCAESAIIVPLQGHKSRPFKDSHRRRSRERDGAVRSGNRADPSASGSTATLSTRSVKSGTGADHIGDCIVGPDFVEVDMAPVDFLFCRVDPRKDPVCHREHFGWTSGLHHRAACLYQKAIGVPGWRGCGFLLPGCRPGSRFRSLAP